MTHLIIGILIGFTSCKRREISYNNTSYKSN